MRHRSGATVIQKLETLFPDFSLASELVLPFSDNELAIYAKAGYGRRLEIGARPALVGIDFTNEFCGPEGSTIEEAIAAYPFACGNTAWHAARVVIDKIMPVIVANGLPTVWLSRDEPSNRPPLIEPTWTAADVFRNNLIEPILGLGYGRTMTKRGPSAFFDTGLETVLRKDGVDTVLLAGAVTSGCVRASAVDAMSHGFKVVVIADGVVDRSLTSHGVALFEMSMKYAAVAGSSEIAAKLKRILPEINLRPSH